MTTISHDSRHDHTSDLVLALLRERLGTGPSIDPDMLRRCDWPRFELLAAHHGLTCLLYRDLERHAGEVPGDLLRRMAVAHHGNALRNLLLRGLLDRVLAAFDDTGIPVLVLKGASLIRSIYEEDGVRRLSDVDLLVEEHDLTRANACLQGIGFEEGKSVEGRGALCDIHALYWHPDMPSVPVELHWRLFEPYRPYRFDLGEVRQAARPLSGSGHAGDAMSIEHELAHLCLHLERHSLIYRSVVKRDDWQRLLVRPLGGGRLIWLYDVALYVQRYSARIDWERFARDAERWSFGAHVHSVLELCRRGLGVAPPMEIVQRLEGRGPGVVESLAHRMVAKERGKGHESSAPDLRALPWSRRALRVAHTWTSIFPPPSYLRGGEPAGPILSSWLAHVRSVLPQLWEEARFRVADERGQERGQNRATARRGSPTRAESEANRARCPTVRADVTFRVVGDELVTYDPTNDRAIVLNASAATILVRCDGRHTASDIARDLAAELVGTPRNATGQILETINRLRAMGLVVP